MISLRDKALVLKEIFSKSKSLFIFLIVFVAIYLLNAVIVQWSNLKLAGTIGVVSLLTSGFYYSITKTTFYTSIIISLLTGILISILAYRSQDLNSKGKVRGFLPSLAVFLGLLAPGCASCGIGLATVIGLGATMASLPLKGLEISLLAICLLIYSVNRALVSFIVCETPIRSKVSKKRKR